MENIIQHNLPQKLLLQPEPPMNLDESQETRMEEHFPSTNSKLVSVPQKKNMSPPKNGSTHMSQSKKCSSFDACQLPAKVLNVEEEVMKSLYKNENYLFIAYIKVHYYLLYVLYRSTFYGRNHLQS